MRMIRRTLALATAALALAGMAACADDASEEAPEPQPEVEILIEAPDAAPAVDTAAMSRTPGGIYYDDVIVGGGEEAEEGHLATVHYSGWLLDGKKFDASVDRAEVFGFELGAGMVIPGWDEGVQGMKVGGVRRLVIPPEMGYGAEGRPPIPPNATLVFDVQLVEVGPVRR